ncbi:MAG: hypothetical protein LQ342_006699 [Letrouitia transgressa]|nr:MAG: hypothetical protein LQ342_006699 [Letrouitia transgressa]
MAALEISNLVDISERISSNTKFLQHFLKTNNLPTPSFQVDTPTEFPNPENERTVDLIREKLLADTRSLFDLVIGPVDRLKWAVWQMIDVSAIQVIYRFKLAQAVPFDGGATYAQIAKTTGLTEHRVSATIRQAAMNKIFYEDSPNHVVHTAISSILVKDPIMWDWVGHFTEEGYPSNAAWSAAMQKYPNSQELNETPFAVAFNYDKPGGFFQYTAENETSQKRFFGAMKGVGMAPGVDYGHVANGYDWEKLGKGTVVDMGGSAGHVSMALAKRFPQLKFVVQDFKETVTASEAALPAEFRDRISYQAHDFFKPQPLNGAAVYMMRHICHCWPDKHLIKILQQNVPAMGPDSKIVVVETIVLPPGEYSYLEERWARNMDLFMFSMLNAQDRSAEEWSTIVKQADPRLRVSDIQKPPGSHDAVIEISLELPN